jgi:hypothetical protein
MRAVAQKFQERTALALSLPAKIHGGATIDFGDSFTFNPSSVLVLEPGITASSVSWGLVDNRLRVPAVAGVPEPRGSALVLLSLAVVCKLWQWAKELVRNS